MNEPHRSQRHCFRRVFFRGRVQGVGFRITAASAARSLRLNGYVRNCEDGSVELVAEGPVEKVEQLVDQLSRHFAGNIERQTSEEVALSEPFDGFEIRR